MAALGVAAICSYCLLGVVRIRRRQGKNRDTYFGEKIHEDVQDIG
jgi:hypothetical protein